MRGPLGGQLTHPVAGADEAFELVPTALGPARDGAAATTRTLPRAAADVELIAFETEAREAPGIRYDRAFGDWTSWLDGPDPRAALARLADALAELHGQGRAHGELGPRLVGWRDGRLSLLIGAHAPAPGQLARALIVAGIEPLSSTAYVAPEVLEGRAAEAASDVYALAAMIHRAVSGQPPLGQLDALPPVMRAALSFDPERRPPAAALAAMLRDPVGNNVALPRPPSAELNTAVQREALRADGAQMSTMLLVLLVLGGAFVFFGAIWLVTTSWGALGEVGHFVLLLALTGGAAGAGLLLERRGYEGTGMTLLLLASCLLWADAAYVLDIEDALSDSGSWAIAAGCVTLASAVLLVVKRGSLYAWVTAIDLAILAGFVGDHLSSGNPEGPALYAALVAGIFCAAALAVSFLPTAALLGLPFAAGAVLATWLSAGAGLFVFSTADHALFATVWPYALVAPAGFVAVVSWTRTPVYKWCAVAALIPLLLLVPSIEALVNHDSAAYLVAPLLVGFAILAALASSPANDLRDLARAVLGVTNVAAAASLLALIKCSDVVTDQLLNEPLLKYFVVWVVGSVGLVVFGYVASGRAVAKPVYRLVEATGLLFFFGVATVLSLFRTEDVFFPILVFAAGAVVLVAGLGTRRVSLLVAAAIALLVNLSLQYFVRLQHLLPTAVLIIGFGVVLLGLGLAYERRLKRLLPLLKAWS